MDYQTFAGRASAHLSSNELRQFERAFAERSSRTLFLDRFVHPQLYRPADDLYIAVSDSQKTEGRNHYMARTMVENPSLDLAALTYLTNPMSIDDNPEPYVNKWGQDSLKFIGPSKRIVKGSSHVFTFEFDKDDLTFFKKQLSWMRYSKHPVDCPVGELYKELTRYCDFQGITVAWSGNKSFHIHIVFSTDLLTVTEGFRNGFTQHWDRLYAVVTRILNPGVEPDMSMKWPEMYRRLPGGTRRLDKTTSLDLPTGSEVPQLVMWEKWVNRAPNGSSAMFWDTSLFIESLVKETRARLGKTVTSLPVGPELDYCGERLRDVFNGETVWPRFDHWTVNDQTNEIRAKFTNDHSDTTPDSYMDVDWKSVAMVGTGRGLSPRSEHSLPKPLGEMLADWLAEYAAIHGRPRTDAEKAFAEVVTDGETGAREIAKIIRECVGEHARAFVCAPEGVSKTTGLFKNHPRIAAWLKTNAHPECVMYAFGDYKAAADKCREFNERNPNPHIAHGVVLRSFDKTYKDVCDALGIMPMTLADAVHYGTGNLWSAIERVQPDVITEFTRLHAEMMKEIAGRNPVYFTVQAVAHNWSKSSPSRLMWAPSYWLGERDADHTALCRAETNLGLLIHDEVKHENLVAAYPIETVEWVREMMDATPEVWHKDNTMVARYMDFHAFVAMTGGPFDLKAEENKKRPQITFEQALDVYTTGNFSDWDRVVTADSGEYDAGSDKSIYGNRIGKHWCVRERTWPLDAAFRTIILTTETVPLKIALHLTKTDVIPWAIFDLDTPRIERNTVETHPQKNITASSLTKVCAGWRKANPTHVIVSNKAKAVPGTQTHAGARGSNAHMGKTIVQTMTYCSPDEFEYLEALNAWTGSDDLIRHRHIDEFNQTAGRNLGFRKREGARHILLVNRNLFERLTGEPKTRIRYAMEVHLTRTGKDKAKGKVNPNHEAYAPAPDDLVPASQLKLAALQAALISQGQQS